MSIFCSYRQNFNTHFMLLLLEEMGENSGEIRELIANTMKWINSMCLCAQLCLNLQPHGPTRLLCPWNFSGNNTRVSCNFLLQGIFLMQELNPCLFCLLHWRVDPLPLAPLLKWINSNWATNIYVK